MPILMGTLTPTAIRMPPMPMATPMGMAIPIDMEWAWASVTMAATIIVAAMAIMVDTGTMVAGSTVEGAASTVVTLVGAMAADTASL